MNSYKITFQDSISKEKIYTCGAQGETKAEALNRAIRLAAYKGFATEELIWTIE